MAIHELKSHPGSFQARWDDLKTAKFRRNDRNFAVGDFLREREWGPTPEDEWVLAYTGREIVSLVTDVRKGGEFGIPYEYCMLSVYSILHREADGSIGRRKTISSEVSLIVKGICVLDQG